MNNYTIIASKAVSAFGGIGILTIEYGIDDYIVVTDVYEGKMSRPAKCKIRTNMQGESYFIHHGRREYLSEYIRTNV